MYDLFIGRNVDCLVPMGADELARFYGVTIYLSATNERAYAKCNHTGRILRHDNKYWVKHNLELHCIPITDTIQTTLTFW